MNGATISQYMDLTSAILIPGSKNKRILKKLKISKKISYTFSRKAFLIFRNPP